MILCLQEDDVLFRALHEDNSVIVRGNSQMNVGFPDCESYYDETEKLT